MDPGEKSNVAGISSVAATSLEPGDLVVSTQPEQVPVLVHYLPDGLRFATPLGPVADPAVMDWRDALSRLRTTQPLLCDEYRRNRATGGFILVDEATNRTVGAGMIIEVG